MISVIVDNDRCIRVDGEQEVRIRNILQFPALASVKHQRICEEMRVGRFVPSISHGPFVLRSVAIKVLDGNVHLFYATPWCECWRCHRSVYMSKSVAACPGCSANRIPNYISIL